MILVKLQIISYIKLLKRYRIREKQVIDATNDHSYTNMVIQSFMLNYIIYLIYNKIEQAKYHYKKFLFYNICKSQKFQQEYMKQV